ncbi:CbtA family protein [Actinoallomurus oryzae]|uniref:CbtA family protein n=1 Tax=Actinoallomurus oryzae TaxID=502180 RepID=A0ABP8QLE4_9ACTN
MERRFIVRGLLVGAIGGILAFVFARIFAEPQIQAAIDYESGRDAAQALLDRAAGITPEAAGSDLFSRTVQANVGIGAGVIVFGAAMGGLYVVAYLLACGRTGNLRPRTLALLVALGGFLGFYLIPFVKYPANPPAIGHEETIRARGGLYLLMVGFSIAFLVLAVLLFSFRLYSVAAQAIMWAAIGLCFAPMAERLLARAAGEPRSVEAPATA